MAKIMLVEDDNNLREIYEARLLAEGYEIVSAHDGEEALALAIKEKPDLIISDIMMPKISGFDMLDILRGTPEIKNTKVIMMTALSQAEDQTRASNLGADRYLVKSQVTLEDVARVAKEVLDKSKKVAAQSADAPQNPLAHIYPNPAAAPPADDVSSDLGAQLSAAAVSMQADQTTNSDDTKAYSAAPDEIASKELSDELAAAAENLKNLAQQPTNDNPDEQTNDDTSTLQEDSTAADNNSSDTVIDNMSPDDKTASPTQQDDVSTEAPSEDTLETILASENLSEESDLPQTQDSPPSAPEPSQQSPESSPAELTLSETDDVQEADNKDTAVETSPVAAMPAYNFDESTEQPESTTDVSDAPTEDAQPDPQDTPTDEVEVEETSPSESTPEQPVYQPSEQTVDSSSDQNSETPADADSIESTDLAQQPDSETDVSPEDNSQSEEIPEENHTDTTQIDHPVEQEIENAQTVKSEEVEVEKQIEDFIKSTQQIQVDEDGNILAMNESQQKEAEPLRADLVLPGQEEVKPSTELPQVESLATQTSPEVSEEQIGTDLNSDFVVPEEVTPQDQQSEDTPDLDQATNQAEASDSIDSSVEESSQSESTQNSNMEQVHSEPEATQTPPASEPSQDQSSHREMAVAPSSEPAPETPTTPNLAVGPDLTPSKRKKVLHPINDLNAQTDWSALLSKEKEKDQVAQIIGGAGIISPPNQPPMPGQQTHPQNPQQPDNQQ
ncbi:MAG: response regulator [bacterium]|nr:response regulator [bacterium]